MIKVSSDAFEQLTNGYHNPDRAFRVMVNGFGWGGPIFGIVLDEQLEDDYLEIKDGIKFVVNSDLKDQFGTFQVDFTSNFFRKGFIISTDYGTGAC